LTGFTSQARSHSPICSANETAGRRTPRGPTDLSFPVIVPFRHSVSCGQDVALLSRRIAELTQPRPGNQAQSGDRALPSLGLMRPRRCPALPKDCRADSTKTRRPDTIGGLTLMSLSSLWPRCCSALPKGRRTVSTGTRQPGATCSLALDATRLHAAKTLLHSPEGSPNCLNQNQVTRLNR
jgi:hypothetical protein